MTNHLFSADSCLFCFSNQNIPGYRTTWPVPTIFNFIERQGKVDHDEMYRVFNMGIGFVLIVPKTSLLRMKTVFKNVRQPWYQIGVIRVRKPGWPQVIFSK